MASISNGAETRALLCARVEDTVKLCDRRYSPCFLGFLDESEQQTVKAIMGKRQDVSWRFFGGHVEAERCLFGVFPDYAEPEDAAFPLVACAFRYRCEQALTHRDFLGALLAAGLKREAIGDILCGEGLSVVFFREEIVPYVLEQITKIGHEGVRIEPSYTGDLPVAHRFLPLHNTVASPRLDAVVKALLGCSREQAARLIVTGMVELDHQPIEVVAASVQAPAVVSVRGHGRYAVDAIGPPTKKGRLNLTARQYV